ncbi:MAG: hypothetical protein HY927_01475 [Elusimicrobia bacterium]|nr:hypothetical protein [Elusimicrobiota bacterium]
MGKRGSSLAEVLIATVLLASAVSTVAAVILSGLQQGGLMGTREQVALLTQGLLGELENYVTADPAPSPEAPGGSWALPGDSCACWALEERTHDVTARLPSELRERFGARMSYTVTVEDRAGKAVRRVEARVDWNES